MPEFTLFLNKDTRTNLRGAALALAGSLVALDQVTKWVVTKTLAYGEVFSVMPSFAFTLRHNLGAAFSFLDHAGGWQRFFFIAVALIISSVIFYWLGRLSERDYTAALGLSCILGGALGNVIDRVFHGYVIDFLLVYYKEWQWPAFNVADTAITLGVMIFAWSLFNKK